MIERRTSKTREALMKYRTVTPNWILQHGYQTYLQVTNKLFLPHRDQHRWSSSFIHDTVRKMLAKGVITDEYRCANTVVVEHERTCYVSPEFAQKIVEHWENSRIKNNRTNNKPTNVDDVPIIESASVTEYFELAFV